VLSGPKDLAVVSTDTTRLPLFGTEDARTAEPHLQEFVRVDTNSLLRTCTVTRPGGSPEIVRITAPVAADAGDVTIGLLLVGDGKAWMDEVAVEVFDGKSWAPVPKESLIPGAHEAGKENASPKR
jgi:hypothetical protein